MQRAYYERSCRCKQRAAKILLPQVAPSKTTSYDAASKSIKSKTVSLSADTHTMKEIILDPGLEMG